MFMKFLIFLVMFAVGILIIKYTEPIVRTFGKSAWAEQYLGAGGSYNLWRLVAIVIILAGFLYLIGSIEFGTWDNLGLDEYSQEQIEE